jgi:hypothetical protein
VLVQSAPVAGLVNTGITWPLAGLVNTGITWPLAGLIRIMLASGRAGPRNEPVTGLLKGHAGLAADC